MANKRYALKEVANVIFFDIVTNKPAIFFDTLKVSTLENQSESAEVRGGQGNNRIMAFDYGRSATLTLQDALLSDVSLSLLAGQAVKTVGIKAVGREVLALVLDGTAPATKVTLAQTPNAGTVTVYSLSGGIIDTEITGFTLSTKDVKFATGQTVGNSIMVFYEYNVSDPNASQITFSSNTFPATYKVVGDTLVRDENGLDRKMQFIIPKAKLKTDFSLAMDAENVATFDFNLDVLVESGTNRLYDLIRL